MKFKDIYNFFNLMAQTMQTDVTVSHINHENEKGFDLWARILRALNSPHMLNKIMIDSKSMKRD